MAEWSALVGAHGSGKSLTALACAHALAALGCTVAGFVELEVLDPDGQRIGWDIVRIDGERQPLARRSSTPTICDYAFDPAGFARAADWATMPKSDVVVIGGIGKLEAAGLGHWPLFHFLVESAHAPHVIACVRDSVLATVALSLPDPFSYVELPCAPEPLARFSRRIAASRRKPLLQAEAGSEHEAGPLKEA